MMDEALVNYCSPTLAAMATGNLFTIPCTCQLELAFHLERMNRQLNRKGVLVRSLRCTGGRALIYVFRPKMLWADLRADGVMDFLIERGYRRDTLCGMIRQMSERVTDAGEFPHEIGLFLGYPLADVVGFIENKGAHFKCAGWWKVYENETAARMLFEKFRHCTRLYSQRFLQGMTVQQLTVAA